MTAQTVPPVPADRSYLFVLGSSRSGGNTALLARAAAEQLPPGTPRRWIDLTALDLPDFRDGVHEKDKGIAEGRFPGGDAERELYEATTSATDIVLAGPLYWYGLSAQLKRYLDHWSGWLNAPALGFHDRMAGRRLWGVAALAHAEHEVADGLSAQLTYSAAYMRMGFGGLLLGRGIAAGDLVRRDPEALTRAKTFFQQEAPAARFPYEEA